MPVHIYALFHLKDEARAYFYVGRTEDIDRRMREHHYHKRNGYEEKYQYMRQIGEAGTVWDYEILETFDSYAEAHGAEYHHVIKLTLAGHALKNMRQGDMRFNLQEVGINEAGRYFRRSIPRVAEMKQGAFAKSSERHLKTALYHMQHHDIPDLLNDKILPPDIRQKFLDRMRADGDENISIRRGNWSKEEFLYYINAPAADIQRLRELRALIPSNQQSNINNQHAS